MPSLRIGIDVGGTFTHGVILRPPGEVVHTARVPTTHTAGSGVAEGVRQVLALLLEHVDARDIELVAHSTTQATNALLEGDVAPVILAAIVPPGEGPAVRRALPTGSLDLGGGHSVKLQRVLIPWEDAARFDPSSGVGIPNGGAGVPARDSVAQASLLAAGKLEACSTEMSGTEARPTAKIPGSGGLSAAAQAMPVAVVQPLAGQHENRESHVAAKFRALGHPVVCASDITQVLGLAARARTAVVNASMLPKMLATARFTAQAVAELLPGVPVQVVRSDGGAMSLAEMQRLPVLSLLSGPAAGASAALARSGLSNVVFIEVGGTSTDITLIKDGRVRHRYATVGGQRLLVPALDLRTVAVGGGSMAQEKAYRFGPRSAHIAGLPYFFQRVVAGAKFKGLETWIDPQSGTKYICARMDDGSLAAITFTDWMCGNPCHNCPAWVRDFYVKELSEREYAEMAAWAKAHLGVELTLEQCLEIGQLANHLDIVDDSIFEPCEIGTTVKLGQAISELCLANGIGAEIKQYTIVAGGGGAPVVRDSLEHRSFKFPMPATDEILIIPDHAVISAIGAALAVSCVSLSKSVAEPSAGDIAELTAEVERRLSAQGAERVSTDYEFDAQRQVLTVTGLGSQPYAQDAQVREPQALLEIANRLVNGNASQLWQADQLSLWGNQRIGNDHSTQHEKRSINTFLKKLISKPESSQQAILLNYYGQCLWQGQLREFWPADGLERETVLRRILELRTQYTDGGPVLPGLALACAGRLIPLDQLASADLIAEVLRWEQLPPDAAGCFLLRG